MTITLSRREILTAGTMAGAAFACPSLAFAGTGKADWTLGVADVEADIAPRALRRVSGAMPKGLAGALYRNGPAKFRRGATSATHWFDGDGLIRKFSLAEDGSASLAARFVDTPKRRQETRLGRMVIPGFGTKGSPDAQIGGPDDANSANTNVIFSGGELLALWEAGSATRLDPDTLATRGPKTYRPDLAQMPFLAHPRVEADGRIWNLGLSGGTALVWRVGANGALEAAHTIALPRASYLHDFTATARHLVIVLQPWIQDKFSLPFLDSLSWRPEQGTKVLVVDKDDLTKQRVYDLPTFAFFHLGDAWEESDGTIRFDGCIEPNPDFAINAAPGLIRGEHIHTPMPVLAMIALHANGRATLTPTRIAAEFPRSDARIAGLPRNFTVHVGLYRPGRPIAQSVAVWDWRRGRDDAYDFGARQLVEEFVFVPRPGATGELAGWLLGTTINLDARATELHVFDAHHVARGPLATWRADVALPVGFHGNFVPA